MKEREARVWPYVGKTCLNKEREARAMCQACLIKEREARCGLDWHVIDFPIGLEAPQLPLASLAPLEWDFN